MLRRTKNTEKSTRIDTLAWDIHMALSALRNAYPRIQKEAIVNLIKRSGLRFQQNKKMSVLEVTISTIIGYVVAVTTQLLVFPLFGIYIEFSTNIAIATIFTFVSILRGYVVRRLFNWLHHK